MCDFTAHTQELPALAGLPAEAIYREFARIAPALTDGRLSMTAAYEHILTVNGAEARPELVRALVHKGMELLLASARLFDDVLPFMTGLRARGIKIAMVSNCDEQARGLLDWLGITPLADALVLSCEVGSAKPAPLIFQRALTALGVSAEAALFVDDNQSFCAGAAELGITAVRIARDKPAVTGDDPAVTGDDPAADEPAAGLPVVRSLAEVEAMLPA